MEPLKILEKGDRIPANHYGAITRSYNESLLGGGEKAGQGRNFILVRTYDTPEILAGDKHLSTKAAPQITNPETGELEDDPRYMPPNEPMRVYMPCLADWVTKAENLPAMGSVSIYGQPFTYLLGGMNTETPLPAFYSRARNRWELPPVNRNLFYGVVSSFDAALPCTTKLTGGLRTSGVEIITAAQFRITAIWDSTIHLLTNVDNTPLLIRAEFSLRKPVFNGCAAFIAFTYHGSAVAWDIDSATRIRARTTAEITYSGTGFPAFTASSADATGMDGFVPTGFRPDLYLDLPGVTVPANSTVYAEYCFDDSVEPSPTWRIYAAGCVPGGGGE